MTGGGSTDARATGRRLGVHAAQRDMVGPKTGPVPVPSEVQARRALGADYDLAPADRRPALMEAFRAGWLEGQKLVEPPVGIPEIAERLRVKRPTVDQWLQRHLLPEPDWTVGGRPAWAWSTIWRWAEATGRMPEA